MFIDILLTIILTSVIQSMFGTGVLLLGTPLLLLYGYDFQFALTVLLPTSVMINFFQIWNKNTLIKGILNRDMTYCVKKRSYNLKIDYKALFNFNWIGLIKIFFPKSFNSEL